MGKDIRMKEYKEGREAHKEISPQYGRQSIVGILHPAGDEFP
jgi:hypothetical protein